MLPSGHLGVLVCDTRRAHAWQDALAAEGITAVLVETDADQAALGAMIVAVPRLQVPAANALITAVTQGRRALTGRRDWTGAAVVLGVALVIVVWAALAR